MAKILLIVEGARTDVRLMKYLLETYGISQEHNIISYNANLYSLFNQMFKDGNPEDMDLMQILKEHESDEEKKKIFNERYSDVLLVFDLDPQDPQFSFEKVAEMLDFFDESSDKGKLYINYPMVEAFYHMKGIPDEDYDSYTATMEELSNRKYKQRVQNESRNSDYRKFAVNKDECNIVIKQNYEKAMKICCKYDYKILPFEYNRQLLEKQFDELKRADRVFVVCTCAFYILDYDSSMILS